MAGLYDAAEIARLEEAVLTNLQIWDIPDPARITLLNVSENATFRVDAPGRAPLVIRIHRPGYHTAAEIESELAWIAALRRDRVVPVPAPLPTTSGKALARLQTANGPRHAVAFGFVAGREPSPEDPLETGFRDLGAITARLHAHARDWVRPAGFTRKTWRFDTTVGPAALWGDWRAGLGLGADGRAVLERVSVALERRLAAWGTGADRFGLIHADLRLANLLVDAGRITVIDFDDCGFGWHGFDFAAAISFFETDPQIPALQDAWVEGYRSVAAMSAAAEAMLPVFVMLRRLQLTAWVASHAETPTAQALGTAFTDGTVTMAERFLAL